MKAVVDHGGYLWDVRGEVTIYADKSVRSPSAPTSKKTPGGGGRKLVSVHFPLFFLQAGYAFRMAFMIYTARIAV